MKKLDRIKLLIDRVIYKTTNKIDGKIYVGQDKYNKSSYFGSGTIIRQMLKKFGKENFTREILAHCNSQEDLSKKERYWIKKLDSTNPIVGYNLATGGTNWYPSYQRVSAYRKKKIYKARSILLSNRWKSKDPTLCSKKVIKRRSKLSRESNKKVCENPNSYVNSKEFKEKHRKACIERNKNEIYIEKLSIAASKMWLRRKRVK